VHSIPHVLHVHTLYLLYVHLPSAAFTVYRLHSRIAHSVVAMSIAAAAVQRPSVHVQNIDLPIGSSFQLTDIRERHVFRQKAAS
jgi:uncharacterized membrane protein YhaH (DUF805 family)